MGIAAVLEKPLRLRKLILFFVLCALTVAYVQVFYNRTVSQLDVTQQNRVGSLVSKYSKQNRKSLFSKANIKHDLIPREIYTSANIRNGLSSKSETKPPSIELINSIEPTLLLENVTLPAVIKQAKVKGKEAKRNKIVEEGFNEVKDKSRTKLRVKDTRASVPHWKHTKSALRRIPFARHLQLEPSFQINGYHGTDLMAVPPYPFDPAFKNPCWTEGDFLRCLPYFFIIGVKKCGTSELWDKISEHPDFVKPSFWKEAQWFARGRFHKGFETFDTYIDMFRNVAFELQYLQKNQSGTLITGEASPSNLHLNNHWRHLPGNENLTEPRYVILDYLHHFLPKAKILILFRDPTDRLYSDYYHQFGKVRRAFSASPKHFHELIVMGLQLYKECLQTRTLRSCVYDESIYNKVGINIQLGIYHVYWQELTRLFPRNQILVIQNEDFKDESRILRTVYSFLEMRPFENKVKNGSRRSNTRRGLDVAKGNMLSETRRLLQDFYKPYMEEMYRISGDETFLYNSKHR